MIEVDVAAGRLRPVLDTLLGRLAGCLDLLVDLLEENGTEEDADDCQDDEQLGKAETEYSHDGSKLLMACEVGHMIPQAAGIGHRYRRKPIFMCLVR